MIIIDLLILFGLLILFYFLVIGMLTHYKMGRCSGNPKKWRFIKYYGDHDYYVKRVRWYVDDLYIVHTYCKLCGATKVRSFVNTEDLKYMGMDTRLIEMIKESKELDVENVVIPD